MFFKVLQEIQCEMIIEIERETEGDTRVGERESERDRAWKSEKVSER